MASKIDSIRRLCCSISQRKSRIYQKPLPSPGGQVSRMAAGAIPPTSRRAYRAAARGGAWQGRGPVASRVAHGRPRGRSGDRSTGWHSVGAAERRRPRFTPGHQRQKPTTNRRLQHPRSGICPAYEGRRQTSGARESSGSCLRRFRARSREEAQGRGPALSR